MKISAIIAEYNPFHLGHLYHIQETKKHTRGKILVIMSGNFTQRGEPAVFDKWTRAKMALLAGADIVIELPTIYATASSEGFAEGAVSILQALHSIDTLSFGAEEPDLSLLGRLAEQLAAEEPPYKDILAAELKKGVSFPVARSETVRKLYGPSFSRVLDKPNTILAIEYLKALRKTQSTIRPYAVQRKDADYHAAALQGTFSSAHAIREALKSGNNAWVDSVPACVRPLFSIPVFVERMFPYIQYCLRTRDKETLSRIRGVSEGLENKLIGAGGQATDYLSLLQAIKSKRYTMTRIKRVLLNCFLGITDALVQKIQTESLYAHILGIKKESMELLSYLSQRSSIPLLSSPAKYTYAALDLDVKATDLYSLLQTPPVPSGKDYTTALPII